MFYDCLGMDTDFPLGNTAVNTGTQLVNANLTVETNFTPRYPNSVIFNVTGIDANTISGVATPTLGLFDAMVYPAAAGTRGLDEDNGKMHYFCTDLTPITISYTTQNNTGGVHEWTSATAEFRAKPQTHYSGGGVIRKRVVS
jgi:hypothetical protein